MMLTAAGDMMQLGLRSFQETIDRFNDWMNQIAQAAQAMPGPAKSRGHRRCDCNCDCCTCMEADPWLECLPCGPKTSNTDVTLEARTGEVRKISLLLENNTSRDCTFALRVNTLMDGCGETLEGANLITFPTPTGVLAPCQCRKVDVLISLQPPFQGGQVYYADICIDHAECNRECVTVGIWVKPDSLVDHLMLCDHCRPRTGRYVEFVPCDCGCCSPGRRFYVCRESGQRSGQEGIN